MPPLVLKARRLLRKTFGIFVRLRGRIIGTPENVGEELMAHVTRRFFLLSSAALSAGCAIGQPAAEGTAQAAQNVRQPVAGQSWRYAKHDLYTRKVVDEQVDRVATVDGSVEIDSSYESAGKERPPPTGWGADLLRKYIAEPPGHSGDLPSEIQDPWGMVVVDPHWGDVQVYEMPIPLWPAQLEPGWQSHFSTRYKTPADQGSLPWDQTMRAQAWETVTVPAGPIQGAAVYQRNQIYRPRFFTHGFREARNPMVRTRSGPVGRARKPGNLLPGRFDHRAAIQ